MRRGVGALGALVLLVGLTGCSPSPEQRIETATEELMIDLPNQIPTLSQLPENQLELWAGTIAREIEATCGDVTAQQYTDNFVMGFNSTSPEPIEAYEVQAVLAQAMHTICD